MNRKQQTTNKSSGDILAILMLAGLTILFFSKVFFSDRLYYIRDIYGVGYQWLHLTIETLKAGYIPLWNPYQLSGVPHLASLATMSLYPLNILLYLFGLSGSTYIYFIILQVFLGGAFLYALMRHWQCSPIPALLAALSYMFSGYFIDFAPNFVSPAVWIPLVFLFLDKAIAQKQNAESSGQWAVGSGQFSHSSLITHCLLPTAYRLLPLILLAGGFLSIEFLTGGIEVAFFTLLALGLYLWFMCLGKKNWLRSLAISHGILILVVTIGVLLAMIQFLPTWELVSQSVRSKQLDYEAASSHFLHPVSLIEFFIPHFFGKKTDIPFWGEPFCDNRYAYFISIYFGVFSIMLGMVAILAAIGRLSSWTRLTFYLTILLVLALALALGPYTPVHYLVYKYVPLMGSLRIPIKYLVLITFAASILGGFGAQIFLAKKRESRNSLPTAHCLLPTAYYLSKWVGLFFLSLSLLLAALLLIDFLNDGFLVQIIFGEYISQETLREVIPYIHKEVFKFLIFLLVGSLLIILTITSKLSPRTSGLLMVFIVIMDLFSAHMQLHPTVSESFYSEQPAVIVLFDKESQFYRFYRSSESGPEIPEFIRDDAFKRYFWFKNTLFPYYSVQNRLYDAAGTFSLRPEEYAILLHAIEIAPLSLKLRLLSLLNVRYVLSFSPLEDEQLKPIAFFPDLRMGVYENVSYLPRAYFVPQGKIIRERVDSLNALISKDFDPKTEVILDENENLLGIEEKASQEGPVISIVKINEYNPNHIKMDVYTTQSGYLVFADSYYPGWKAFIDEENTKILRANHLLRAVPVGSGQHTVRFQYEPSSYRVGLFVSLTTLMLMMSCWFLGVRARPAMSLPVIYEKKRDSKRGAR